MPPVSGRAREEPRKAAHLWEVRAAPLQVDEFTWARSPGACLPKRCQMVRGPVRLEVMEMPVGPEWLCKATRSHLSKWDAARRHQEHDSLKHQCNSRFRKWQAL